MNDQNSSAQPERLLAYAAAAETINQSLLAFHAPLAHAIQRFQATCTEFPVPLDLNALPGRLVALTSAMQEHDRWVRDVALGFLAADALSVDPGSTANMVAQLLPTVPALAVAAPAESESFVQRILRYISEFVQQMRLHGSVSEAEARQIFDDMADEKDIPYRFSDDGCYARAHEMLKRIAERYGIERSDIRKVFIYGDLEADTPYVYEPVVTFQDGTSMASSTTDGTVNWGWHVAPILKVRQGDAVVDMVIDPSLASGPITLDEWKNIMNDPDAQIEITDYRQYTPNYRFTNDRQEEAVENNSHDTLARYLKPCINEGYCEP